MVHNATQEENQLLSYINTFPSGDTTYSFQLSDNNTVRCYVYSGFTCLHRFIIDLSSPFIQHLLCRIPSLITPRLNYRFRSAITGPQTTPRIVEITDDELNEIHEVIPAQASTSNPKQPYNRAIPLPFSSTPTSSTVKGRRKKVTVDMLLEEKAEYVCRECFKHFDKKSNMMRHEATVHSKKDVFDCPYCSTRYKHPSHFANHLRSHENYEYSCELCGFKVRSQNALRAHRKRKCEEKRMKGNEKLLRMDSTPPTSQLSKEELKKAHEHSLSRLRKPYDLAETL